MQTLRHNPTITFYGNTALKFLESIHSKETIKLTEERKNRIENAMNKLY